MENFNKYDDIYVIREGDHYTISREAPDLPQTIDRIPYDTALGCMVTDSSLYGCLILVKGSKLGFMTIKEYHDEFTPHYFSKANPFIYDSIEFITCAKWQENAGDGENKACLLLEKNGKWGVAEVYQESDSCKPFKHLIPIEFTKDEVMRKILALYPETTERIFNKIDDFYSNTLIS